MRDPDISPDERTPLPHSADPARSFWHKLGAGSLTISILLHAVLVAIGAIWIFRVIEPVKEDVAIISGSGGGGSPSSESMGKQHRVRMMQPDLTRVSAVGSVSTLVLPEPDDAARMTSLGTMGGSGLSGGLGGTGDGGGRGNLLGPGSGNGLNPGMVAGGPLGNPFGKSEAKAGGLSGTFYDLKQTPDLKSTGITDDGVRGELKLIAEKGFKSRYFTRFFKAPRKLYQTKFIIPRLPADEAPAAFEVGEHVQPRRWFVVYQGAVEAPKSGRFRFVGCGDDALMVRFNTKLVFDYGYTMACTGSTANATSAENHEANKNTDAIRNFSRVSPMPLPNINYKYASTPRINRDTGGVGAGAWFNVRAGEKYPVEIVLSEIPGGVFTAILLIEEEGMEYQKDPAGYPVLPLFRMDGSQPDMNQPEMPPIAPDGPIWKSVGNAAKEDI